MKSLNCFKYQFKDLYKAAASKMFEVEQSKVTKKQRNIVKFLSHGYMYSNQEISLEGLLNFLELKIDI